MINSTYVLLQQIVTEDFVSSMSNSVLILSYVFHTLSLSLYCARAHTHTRLTISLEMVATSLRRH